MPHPAARYLTNRVDFYTIVLDRLPYSGLKESLQRLLLPVEPETALLAALEAEPAAAIERLDTSLQLDDLLKKPAQGSNLARTTISIVEFLIRAKMVERTGLVLFGQLAASSEAGSTIYSSAAQRHQSCLSALAEIEDALRYHRSDPR